MISLTQVYADDDEAPSTQGLRIGYGFFGAEKNDYPWGEFWVAFRDRDDYEISAVGLSAAPIGLYHRRVGLGPIFDLGALRRERTGDTAYALTVGAGIEGFIRLRKNWDVVSALQATYRTTSDIEYQARFGIRFHHRKLPSVRREY